MKLFIVALVFVFMSSVPLSGCPTCLGSSKEYMHGKSQLYKALSGMKVSQQKQLVQLVHRLNQHKVEASK